MSGVCKSFMRNELEHCRMLLSVILYACVAFHWLRVHILAHKPAALTAIYFLSVWLACVGIKKGKVHRCAGTEALYRPYGP